MKKAEYIYHIHVTVAKFIKEGGKLKRGRTIYGKSTENNLYHYPCGTYLKTDAKTATIIIRNGKGQFSMIDMICYVEMPVNPVYI